MRAGRAPGVRALHVRPGLVPAQDVVQGLALDGGGRGDGGGDGEGVGAGLAVEEEEAVVAGGLRAAVGAD